MIWVLTVLNIISTDPKVQIIDSYAQVYKNQLSCLKEKIRLDEYLKPGTTVHMVSCERQKLK